MSLYQQLVDLSAEQLEAFKCGNIPLMHDRMIARGKLIGALPTPGQDDLVLLRRAVRLDQELAAALRARMLELRASAAQVHQRRTNLNGYRQGSGASARLLNFVL